MKNTLNRNNCEETTIIDDIFKKFVEKKKPGKRNIIVIDLDGCIFNNLPRQEKIIEERLRLKYNLPEIPKHAKRNYKKFYNLFETINVKLEEKEGLKDDFLRHFLDNSYLHHDSLINGADLFISELISMGFEVQILTGRHHETGLNSMKKGTLQSLKMHGIFVDNKNIRLFMKPNKDIKDMDFKIQFLKEKSQNPKHNFIAVIDNETKMLNEASKILPDTIFIRFNGAQSQNIEFDGINIDNWNDIVYRKKKAKKLSCLS